MPTDHRYRGHPDSKVDSDPTTQEIKETSEELEFNYSTLLDVSSTSQILFRITDPTSISPLYWTGDPSTSGFGCPNLYLASLDQQTYHKVFQHLSTSRIDTPFASRSDSGWEEEPYIRHSVLDHVQGREKQTCLNTLTSIDERPGTPEDERSPWISTSNNLIWVIYDIVRRLVFLKRDIVYLTIISHPHSSRTSTSRPHDPSPSPLLHKQDSETGDQQGGAGYGGNQETEGREGRTGRGEGVRGRGKEIIINPIPILRITHPRAKELMLSVSMKENYELARRASELSGEMLIWGRVFGDSIIGHLEFTRDVRPFPHHPILLHLLFTSLSSSISFLSSSKLRIHLRISLSCHLCPENKDALCHRTAI